MAASVWHTDILMHVTAHRGLYEHQSLHWKLTLGENILATPGTRTQVALPYPGKMALISLEDKRSVCKKL